MAIYVVMSLDRKSYIIYYLNAKILIPGNQVKSKIYVMPRGNLSHSEPKLMKYLWSYNQIYEPTKLSHYTEKSKLVKL
jgi:hypothetical protein